MEGVLPFLLRVPEKAFYPSKYPNHAKNNTAGRIIQFSILYTPILGTRGKNTMAYAGIMPFHRDLAAATGIYASKPCSGTGTGTAFLLAMLFSAWKPGPRISTRCTRIEPSAGTVRILCYCIFLGEPCNLECLCQFRSFYPSRTTSTEEPTYPLHYTFHRGI